MTEQTPDELRDQALLLVKQVWDEVNMMRHIDLLGKAVYNLQQAKLIDKETQAYKDRLTAKALAKAKEGTI